MNPVKMSAVLAVEAALAALPEGDRQEGLTALRPGWETTLEEARRLQAFLESLAGDDDDSDGDGNDNSDEVWRECASNLLLLIQEEEEEVDVRLYAAAARILAQAAVTPLCAYLAVVQAGKVLKNRPRLSGLREELTRCLAGFDPDLRPL